LQQKGDRLVYTCNRNEEPLARAEEFMLLLEK
jgi:hypothetical protein